MKFQQTRSTLFDMLDAPTLLRHQKLGDHESVALGYSLLGAHQAKWSGHVVEPTHEQISGPIEKCAIRRTPVLEIAEQVAELED